MSEEFATGLLIAAFIFIFFFLKKYIPELYELFYLTISRRDSSHDKEKTNFLIKKYNHLLKTTEGKNNIDEDLFIIDVFAIMEFNKWKVYKTLKAEYVDVKEDIVIYEINDQDLTDQLKKEGII
jgi:hypothetical protein